MTPKRLVIAGGAAAHARRLGEDCSITVFERGPHVCFANCGLPWPERAAFAFRLPAAVAKGLSRAEPDGLVSHVEDGGEGERFVSQRRRHARPKRPIGK